MNKASIKSKFTYKMKNKMKNMIETVYKKILYKYGEISYIFHNKNNLNIQKSNKKCGENIEKWKKIIKEHKSKIIN